MYPLAPRLFQQQSKPSILTRGTMVKKPSLCDIILGLGWDLQSGLKPPLKRRVTRSNDLKHGSDLNRWERWVARIVPERRSNSYCCFPKIASCSDGLGCRRRRGGAAPTPSSLPRCFSSPKWLTKPPTTSPKIPKYYWPPWIANALLDKSLSLIASSATLPLLHLISSLDDQNTSPDRVRDGFAKVEDDYSYLKLLKTSTNPHQIWSRHQREAHS